MSSLFSIPNYNSNSNFVFLSHVNYFRHNVCVFSIKDLSTILKSNGYIINKVMTVYDAAIGEKQVARENFVTLRS